ncbi:MAG: hypothetical protein WAV74_14350 [Anaerolineae bacterium]
MAPKTTGPTWKPADIIRLINKTGDNVHLHLNTGEFRLDAHRSMKFTASILESAQVKELLSSGAVAWEKIK